jgi:hypothetical protein
VVDSVPWETQREGRDRACIGQHHLLAAAVEQLLQLGIAQERLHRLAEILVLCQGGDSSGRGEDAPILCGAERTATPKGEVPAQGTMRLGGIDARQDTLD